MNIFHPQSSFVLDEQPRNASNVGGVQQCVERSIFGCLSGARGGRRECCSVTPDVRTVRHCQGFLNNVFGVIIVNRGPEDMLKQSYAVARQSLVLQEDDI